MSIGVFMNRFFRLLGDDCGTATRCVAIYRMAPKMRSLDRPTAATVQDKIKTDFIKVFAKFIRE